MNCPMRLGLSNTTCPQQLREQNPVKVIFCPLRLRTSRSSSRKSPLFLLVGIDDDSKNHRVSKRILNQLRSLETALQLSF
jgi:hypothetical protein